jgi:hypothetical protein
MNSFERVGSFIEALITMVVLGNVSWHIGPNSELLSNLLRTTNS